MKRGTTTLDEALATLRDLPVADLGFARLDTHRELRQGMPEAIYGEGKTPDQCVSIARALLERTTGPVLCTRTPPDCARALIEAFPEAEYHERSRLVVLRRDTVEPEFTLLVAAAGTSDLPVADEAALAAEAFGLGVERITDVGVAGLHRVLAVRERLRAADAVVVVAGMEGALASIVGGLTPAPVIAVPTSVGYGASFEGLAALLAMLNSCAAGVAVMNIDNGFGAASFALKLARSRAS